MCFELLPSRQRDRESRTRRSLTRRAALSELEERNRKADGDADRGLCEVEVEADFAQNMRRPQRVRFFLWPSSCATVPLYSVCNASAGMAGYTRRMIM